MPEFFVKATVCATIDAEFRAEAEQALCNRLWDVEHYTVATVTALPNPACPKCGGSGEIRFMNMHPEDYEPPMDCNLCGGTGRRTA